MTEDSRLPTQRRSFLKGLGGVAGVATLAGCAGGGGGSDGGGSDGGSSGDGGGSDGGGSDGGSGGDVTSGSESKPLMKTALPPSGFYLPILDWFEKEGTPNEVFQKHGFEGIEIQATWDDATLFAADKTHFSHGSALEGTATAINQGWKMSYFGTGLAALGGLMVKTGGPYDPEKTGGAQQSLDKLAEDNAVFGHWGWNSGTLLNTNVVMQDSYGHAVKENGGSFEFQVMNAPGAVSPLILKDRLDVGLTDPIHAGKGLTDMIDGKLTPLFFNINKFAERDLGYPCVNTLGLKQETYDQYPEAAEAYVEMWDLGFKWMYEQADSGELAKSAYELEGFPATNEQQAQFLIDVYMLGEKWFQYSSIPADASYTDGIIQAEKKYLKKGVELGVVPENWKDAGKWHVLEGNDNPDNPNAFPV